MPTDDMNTRASKPKLASEMSEAEYKKAKLDINARNDMERYRPKESTTDGAAEINGLQGKSAIEMTDEEYQKVRRTMGGGGQYARYDMNVARHQRQAVDSGAAPTWGAMALRDRKPAPR
jgi:hypothetical protein